MWHPSWFTYLTGSWDLLDAQTRTSILTHVSSLCSLIRAAGLQEARSRSRSCLEIPRHHFWCILVVKASHKNHTGLREISFSPEWKEWCSIKGGVDSWAPLWRAAATVPLQECLSTAKMGHADLCFSNLRVPAIPCRFRFSKSKWVLKGYIFRRLLMLLSHRSQFG